VDLDPGAGIQLGSSIGSTDNFVVKVDGNGDFIWGFTLNGDGGENLNSIDVDASGNVYLTGYSNSDSIDIDPGSGAAIFHGISGILFVQDFILAKYNSDGEYQWGFRTGQRATDTGHSVKVDDYNNVIVVGSTGDANVDFDPGAGTFYLGSDSFAIQTSFLAHYTSNGDFVDAFALDDSASNQGVDLALFNGKAWITGYFSQTTFDIDPGSGTTNLSNAGGFDIYIAGYEYPYAVGIENRDVQLLDVYPNPVNDFVKVEIGKNVSAKIELRDVAGKLLKTENILQMPCTLSLKGLPAGSYFIICESGKTVYANKILKAE